MAGGTVQEKEDAAVESYPATVDGEGQQQSKPLEILEPNATLYVSNIDWNIKKPLLRRALHNLFSRHGKILEIITLRREGLRGQAWVIFEDVASATSALQAEQNFPFFGKDLKIAYAKEKSDRIAKLDGTYLPKDRRAKREAQEAAVRKKIKLDAEEQQRQYIVATSVEEQNGLPPGGDSKVLTGGSAAPSEPPAAPPETSAATPAPTTGTAATAAKPPTEAASAPPSNILFAQDLPAECNEMMLAMLFRQYAGYKEVRIPRPGLAFIEFDDEPHATLALRGLNGFKLTLADTLNLKYGKK